MANAANEGNTNGIVGKWVEFTTFLSDVRVELRKAVFPSRKEVESTTVVVIIAVMLFGIFFFVADSIFSVALKALLRKLSGSQ